MSKELVEKETNEIGTSAPISFGADIDAGDLERDNIILVQKMTDIEEAPDAKAGDYLRTDTFECVGGAEKPVEIIPIYSYKSWRLKGEGGKSFGSKPFKVGEDLYEVTGVTDSGDSYEHQLQRNVLCLLRSDIEELPFVMCFRATSTPAAKRIATIATKLAARGGAPWDSSILISSVAKKNDFGTFFASAAGVGEPTTEEERQVAAKWYAQVSQAEAMVSKEETGSVSTDEDDDDIPF